MGLSKLKENFLTLFPALPGKPTSDRGLHSRIVDKDGKLQICLDQISLGKRKRFLRNPFTTILDHKWRWVIVIFSIGFMLTWLLFAGIYYIIAQANGDFDEDNDSDHEFCFVNVDSFTAAFLFSLETQHTIGYGSRSPTSACSMAVFSVYVQFIIGVAVQCVTAGIVVSKLQMGKRTSKAMLFSHKAVIGKCNDNVCLMVRIANAGTSGLVSAKGYAVMLERYTVDGDDEILTESIFPFVSENGSERLNMLWPAVVHCQVTADAEEFIKKLQSPTNELIIIIEGILEATGQNVQLRTSYLAEDIEIGKQFVDISPQLEKGTSNNTYHHIVDYADFDSLLPDDQWNYGLS